ncbi:MAG: hypothetical protein PF508_03105 [Spirochaeta sp.]|jgi:tetratricopeptide (TPR) repeat protein|nr:hypothetical protein [Spirochaeta sp.]
MEHGCKRPVRARRAPLAVIVTLAALTLLIAPGTLPAQSETDTGTSTGTGTGPVSGQPARTISIVVQDLQPTGGVGEDDVDTLNEYLRGQISGLPNYQVIEQARIRELMEVNERQQLSGLYAVGDDPEQLRLVGADQVVLGSVGKLFTRVVVSVRLVELVTGEIVFSYTSHAAEENIHLRLDEIVQRIREYGLLRYQTIRVADIQELADRRRYAEAQERLEAYLRQQRRIGAAVDSSAEFLELQQTINANLYEDYLKQARRARRRDDFVDARRAITRAIALQPAAEAMEERDRIRLAQEEYQREVERQERLIELRAEEQDRRADAGVYLSPWDAVEVYFATISTRPHRLSLYRSQPVAGDLAPPDTVESWGISYSKAFVFGPRAGQGCSPGDDAAAFTPRVFEAFGNGRAGLTLNYREGETANMLSIHPVLSPYTGLTVHLLNVLLSVGLDGGLLMRYGEDGDDPTRWTVYPTVGVAATTDLLIFKNLGVHLGARVDYLFGSDASAPFTLPSEPTGDGAPPTGDTAIPRADRRSPFMFGIFAGVSL